MRPKLKWSIISVACFIAAGLSWWYGEQIADKNNTPNADPGPAATNEIQSGVPLQPQPLVSIGQNPPSLNTTSDAGARAKSKTSRQLPADDGYILRNTTGSVAELA
ncbi:MAG: hypothetical protein K9N48_03960, partial [Verrucomicrobia bacterium]|nr:hypothetical protein [Verrucomicrobiota bacterium]